MFFKINGLIYPFFQDKQVIITTILSPKSGITLSHVLVLVMEFDLGFMTLMSVFFKNFLSFMAASLPAVLQFCWALCF